MRRQALTTLVCGLLVLLPAAAARGSYDPVGAGATRITLAPSFVAALKGHGVRLIGRAPVRISGRTISFPVSGGRVDPVAARGSVDHEGALVFQAGHHRLPLKSLQLKTTQAHSPLSAKFGGGQLKLADQARLVTARAGFGMRARVAAITLSAKVAERLDKKLGLRGVFEAGQPFGSSLTDAQPITVAIEEGGDAQLELAPEFAAKLSSLFVAVNPIFPAERVGAPFTLPIAAGQIAPDASTGVLELAGSLEAIQQGGGQLFWRELWPDLGGKSASVEVQLDPSPPYAGELGRVPILDFSPTAVSADPKLRTISLTGAQLNLQATAAQALNEAFAAPQGRAGVFGAGEPLGTLSFTAQAH